MYKSFFPLFSHFCCICLVTKIGFSPFAAYYQLLPSPGNSLEQCSDVLWCFCCRVAAHFGHREGGESTASWTATVNWSTVIIHVSDVLCEDAN